MTHLRAYAWHSGDETDVALRALSTERRARLAIDLTTMRADVARAVAFVVEMRFDEGDNDVSFAYAATLDEALDLAAESEAKVEYGNFANPYQGPVSLLGFSDVATARSFMEHPNGKPDDTSLFDLDHERILEAVEGWTVAQILRDELLFDATHNN